MAITHPTSVRNAMADLVVDLADAGSGNGQLVFMTSGDAEVATLTLSKPAFGAASSGVATGAAVTADESATGGTIAKFKVTDSNGNIAFQGSVGVSGSGADAILSSLSPAPGDRVSVDTLSYTAPL